MAAPIAPGPSPTSRGIHDLDKRTVAAPDDDEVREPLRVACHDHRGQRRGFGQQQVVQWQHELLGLEAELHCNVLYRVNRRTVDVGLTGLLKPRIADPDPETLEETFE